MTSMKSPLARAPYRERAVMVMRVRDREQRAPAGGDALRQWTEQAHWQLLSFHKGRVVEEMDNGLAMEFADARSCLQAAFALGRLAKSISWRAAKAKRLEFCAGAHLFSGSTGDEELFGRAIRLASGVAALAEPGEVLLSASLRQDMRDGVDAEFEDLGYRTVEAGMEPVRLFRAHSTQGEAPDWSAMANPDRRPGLAVIPFQGGALEAEHRTVGELIAEGVIARLSHSIGFRIISRQSTSALRDRTDFGAIQRHLGASFVLSGTYSLQGRKLIVHAELADARSHALLWSGQLQHTVGDLLEEKSELSYQLACSVAKALGGRAEVRKAVAQPLPCLDGNLLLLTGMSMTHSPSAAAFQRGREALTELSVRYPRLALPRAWLGLLHALNVATGQSKDVEHDTRQACEQTLRALLIEPGNAMALAADGYIQCQLLGEPDRARMSLDAAIDANPSEPFAWLFRSLFSCMWSSGAAVAEASMAHSLSPADPLRYLFDVFMGNALLAERRHREAIAYARRSLKANRHHAPTLRLLLTAQAELGKVAEAKDSLDMLRAEVPGLSVSSYLRTGSAESPMRQRMATAMRQLSLAEN